MNTPKNLKYAATHEWVDIKDGSTALIGLTDFAQKKMGKLVFINLPLVGDELTVGRPFCDVESVKAVADVVSPVKGTVTEVNEELLDVPGLLNEDPYGAWLIKADVISEDGDLLTAKEYEEICAGEE